MGLKNWLAGTVSGPQGYGNVLGRQAREGGSALANAVFLSHGSIAGEGPTTIFDTVAEMETAGYTRRYELLSRLDVSSLNTDEFRLFRNLSTAMISFAFIVNSNAALNNMRPDNASKFSKGLGSSVLQSTVDCGLFISVQAAQSGLLSYASLVESCSIPTILNMETPASGDFLEYLVTKSIEPSGTKTRHYGVVRGGITGFDLVAVPLVTEVVKAIGRTTEQYRW